MNRKIYTTAMKELVSRKAFPVTFLVLALMYFLFPGVTIRGNFQLAYFGTVANLITGPELYVVILATVTIPGAVAGICRNQFYDVEKTTQMGPGRYLLFRLLGYTTVLWACWHVFPVCALTNYVQHHYRFEQFAGKTTDLLMRIAYGEFLFILPSCFCMAAVATAITLVFRRALPGVLCFSAWIAGNLCMHLLERLSFIDFVYTGRFFRGFLLNYKCPIGLQTVLGAMKIYTVPHLLLWSGYILLVAGIAFVTGYMVLKKKDMVRV